MGYESKGGLIIKMGTGIRSRSGLKLGVEVRMGNGLRQAVLTKSAVPHELSSFFSTYSGARIPKNRHRHRHQKRCCHAVLPRTW